MKNLLLFCTTLLLLCTACRTNTSHQGFSSLSQVYDEFAKVLQSQDEAQLHSFCTRIVPNETTLQYMRKHNINVNAFPKEFDESGHSLSRVADHVHLSLGSIMDKMKRYNLLEQVKHSSSATYKTDILKLGHLETERTDRPMQLEAGDLRMSYTLGELVKINGQWHLFSIPESSFSFGE